MGNRLFVNVKNCLYWLGLNTVSKLVRFFFGGLGLMLYVLKWFPLLQQILSGLVVSVRSILDPLSRGFKSYCMSCHFFFSNWKDLHLHKHFQLEISCKCDIKAQNSSTLCKLYEGRKGLRPMGSNADLIYMPQWWHPRTSFSRVSSCNSYSQL